MQQKVLDGRYELDHKIGEGGMARVYAGRDLRLSRRVAIKIPHKHFSSDPDFLERFRHEAQAAAMLAHPNIVDVYDVGQDGDIHYIVMEFVEGTDLKTLINREGPLPVAQAVGIAEQIARGLHAAHRAGMVHRDIKPQNVIVTADGQAHVTDFGVAKSQLSTALTETGVAFGTVDYLSPEQARGRPATAQSDLYALGVVLYEMLTGRLPFQGDSAVAVAMKHATEPPPPPRQLNPQIPQSLEKLMLRALAKEPAQRPQSALEFGQLLASYNQVSQQETMLNPGVVRPPPRPPSPPPPQQARQPVPSSNQGRGTTGSTGRVPMPAPRPASARAPRQEGIGCGVFLVGMLVLAGVLGVVFLFSTGTFSGLFAGTNRPNPTSVPPVQATATVAASTPSPTPDQRQIVPDLVGFSSDAANTALRQRQLVPVRQDANDATTPFNTVIRQEVAPGTPLAPGQPVTYTVSLGPVVVSVLDVVGLRAENARQQLEAAGLLVELIEESSSSVTAGFVISQSLSGGLRVAQGETVVLRVSRGDVVRFPDIIGLPREQAESVLRTTAGLELIFVDIQGPDRLGNFESYAPNEVVSAQIENGAGLNNGDLVPRGSRIILGVRAP